MVHFRLLCLATAGFLYKSLLTDKNWNNKFKVTAEPEPDFEFEDNEYSETTFQLWDKSLIESPTENSEQTIDITSIECPPQNIEQSICITEFEPPTQSSRTSTPRKEHSWACSTECIQARPDFPTISSLGNDNYQVCYKAQTGIPIWTLELVNKKLLGSDHCCQYCVAIKKGMTHPIKGVAFSTGGRLQIVDAISCHTNFEIDPCVYKTRPPQVHRFMLQTNSIWDDFFHYVKFIAETHKNVYVCSGPLYTMGYVVDDNNEVINTSSNLTHFFKVVLAENENGSYRFECYRFENIRMVEDHPNIKKFKVPRSDLENDAEFLIFQDIKSHMITDTEMHPEFSPHWTCDECFPPLCN